jgi:carboxyl-terminal processing protease
MNREKVAWLVSLLLVAMLAFHLPRNGVMAQRESDYAFVRRLVDIHRQVAANYVEDVEDTKLQQGALEGMFGQLDPFSMYVPPQKQKEFDALLEGSFEGVGIQLNQNPDTKEIEVITPIEGSPAFKAGVMAGDIILRVNGESIAGMKIEDVTKKVKGKVGTSVTLRVKHTTGEEADLTMTRQSILVPTVKGFKRQQNGEWDWYVSPEQKIGYIRLTQFTDDMVDRVREALTGNLSNGGKWKGMLNDGMKGLIIDLRFNPGGRLDEAVELVDLFIEKGVIVSTRGRSRPEKVITATGQGTLPYFPMVVLVNEHSASASEIVAGSLKDNGRALVVGDRTYGKGSVQELINLEGNQGELKLTVAYYYLPSGRLVHRKKDAKDWGVEPHINIPLDEATQRKVLMELDQHERFLPPTPRAATTRSTTRPAAATESSSTQPASADLQLQRAVDTMVGMIVMETARNGGTVVVPRPVQATRPEVDVGGPGERQIIPADKVPPGPDDVNPKGPVTKPSSRPASTRPATTPATR